MTKYQGVPNPVSGAKILKLPDHIDTRGIDLDGRWVVVNKDGLIVIRKGKDTRCVKVMSIRSVHTLSSRYWVGILAPDMRALTIPYPAKMVVGEIRSEVPPMWRGKGIEVSRASSEWFTEYLSREKKDTYRLIELAKPNGVIRRGKALPQGNPSTQQNDL